MPTRNDKRRHPLETLGGRNHDIFRRCNELFWSQTFNAVIRLARQPDADPRLITYFEHKIADYTGTSQFDEQSLTRLFRATQGTDLLYRPVLHLCMQQAVRFRALDFLHFILRELAQAGITPLNAATTKAVLFVLLESGDRAMARTLLDGYLDNADTCTRLYLSDVNSLLAGHDPPHWRRLLDLIQDRLRNDSKFGIPSPIVQSYTRLPQRSLDFMDIRYNQQDLDNLQARLLETVVKKEPYSLLRLGDGEAYVFDIPDLRLIPQRDKDEDDDFREHFWWQTSVTASLRKTIAVQAREAVACADIIGFPSVYRLLHDRLATRGSFPANRGQRSLAILCGQLGRQIPDQGRIFTEERCHHLLFSHSYLKRLMSAADKVVIISCWNSGSIPWQTGTDISWIVIPPEAKLNRPPESPLPYRFNSVLQSLDHVGPGYLVLVAAGVIGKIFIGHAHRNGAVALDIGSAIDYLAGHQTRSVFDRI